MGLHGFLSQTFFIALFVCFLYCDRVAADVYTVGGDEGWTTSYNYLEWSQGYSFTVGDVLVFNYVRGQHNTLEVTEDTFRSCDDSSGVIKRYENGNDRVTLDESRNYWFICSIPGHCLGGMKVKVEVSGKEGGGASVETKTNGTAPATDQASNGVGRTRRWSFRSSGLTSVTLLILLLSIY